MERICGLILLVSFACASPEGPPRVVVHGTMFTGARFGDEHEVAFKGIAYAVPPVGELRFRPPRPLEFTEGEKTATEFPPICPQPVGESGGLSWYWDIAEAFGQERSVVAPTPRWDEDCLYLNVWSANWNGEVLQPVMVWIHGGANHTGWSYESLYHGETLARRGVVVVSINYRVGVFGFLAHESLTAESVSGASGNYGLLDQIEALKWVQRNIEAFGGDPNRVTIFGESAGAADVGYLLLSPLAKGLFHRAISQSGGYQVSDFRDLADEEARGQKLAERVGNLRAVSAAKLLEEAAALGSEQDYGPNIDGWALPGAPARLHLEGRQQAIPLLIGANADEWSMYVPEGLEPAEYDARQRQGTNEYFVCPSQFVARTMAEVDTLAYLYYFTRALPGSGAYRAYHGAELAYVFGTAETWHRWESVDEHLNEMMMNYWVQFAKTGNPNSEGLPYWPPFGEGDAYMELGDTIRAGTGLEAEICRAFERELF